MTKPEDAECKSTPVNETNKPTKNAQGGWEVVKTAKAKGKAFLFLPIIFIIHLDCL